MHRRCVPPILLAWHAWSLRSNVSERAGEPVTRILFSSLSSIHAKARSFIRPRHPWNDPRSYDSCGPFAIALGVLQDQLGFSKSCSDIPIAQCSASAQSVPSGRPNLKRSMRLNHITPRERTRFRQRPVRPRLILADMPSISAPLRKLRRSTQCVPQTITPTLQRPRASTIRRSEEKIFRHFLDYRHLFRRPHSVNVPSARLSASSSWRKRVRASWRNRIRAS